MDIIQQLGLDLIRALQTFSPALDGPMLLLSFLGGAEFFLIALPLIYWSIDSRLGIRIFLILLCVYLPVSTLKLLLHQPRPYWIGSVIGLSTEPDYGIPSGHAANSMVVFGYFAARYPWRKGIRLARFSAGALVALIGLSRMYLGVHFPHDVLAGWVIGAATLFVFLRWAEPAAAWLLRLPTGHQLTLILLFSAAGLLLAWWIQLSLLDTPDPESWRDFAVLARSLSNAVTVGGALFGAASGHLLMRRYVRFSVGGDWTQRAARYLLGVGVVVLLYFGLDAFFALLASDETALGYALRFIRYAAATLWVTLGAPWLFIRLGLASREA